VLLVHTPIHASWLNQIEIYFSIVQRKVLTPNDFKSLNELEQRLLAFQQRYEETASPFQWTFTRKDLTTLLTKIENKRLASAELFLAVGTLWLVLRSKGGRAGAACQEFFLRPTLV
jgi:hypothetical protein